MKLGKKILLLVAVMTTLILGGTLTASAASKKCPDCGSAMTCKADEDSRYRTPEHKWTCPNIACDYNFWGITEKCSMTPSRMEIVYYYNDSKNPSNGHMVYKNCSVCGMEEFQTVRVSEPHTFNKKNVCKCGYKQIIPGNTKILSAKQSGKMKKIKGTTAGFWYKTYSGTSKIPTWHYQKPTKYNNKGYKIKFKLKKAKNVDYYLVSTKKNPEASAGTAKQQFKKTSFTYNYISKKKVKKVTLYVTPVSKTGNYGKTIKKTIKLK